MNPAWAKLRKDVLAEVTPSRSLTRTAQQASRRLAERAQRVAKALGTSIEPRLVGSLEKGTHLRPAPDIDLFLLFDPTTPREQLEELGVKIGKKILRSPTLKYAEHPYVHGRFAKFAFDVVPAYKVRDPKGRLSAVDRSPFHAEFVRRKLKPSQQDEVRLLKQFLKGTGCYGAETATSGFSGYLAELLILKFGTFDRVGRAFADEKPPRRLSLGRASGASLGGELVFVDPVDATRNAAAAVSADRYARFVRACRAFLAHPSRNFFWPAKPKPAAAEDLRVEVERRGVLALELPTPSVRPDAVAPHLRRLADKVARRLVDEGFEVRGHVAEPLSAGRFLVLWEHAPRALPEIFEHRGPSADDAANSRRFLQKWQGHPDAVDLPHPTDGRWRVKVRRRERTPRELLDGKVADILQGVELPPAQRRRARLRAPDELLGRAPARLALTKLLLPRDPWAN